MTKPTVEELLKLCDQLSDSYKEFVPPRCHICGHARDRITAVGMGRVTYRCASDAADPTGKSELARPAAWKHFSDSEFETALRGDPDVISVCVALRERLVGEQQAIESKRRFIASSHESSSPEPSDGKE